jgi:hypothetical protein
MKKETTGKKYTRKTKIISEEGDSFEDFFDSFVDRHNKDKKKYGHTFLEELQYLKKNNQQLLKDKNLPYNSKVWQIPILEKNTNKITGYEWVSEKPITENRIGVNTLSNYLEKVKGYEHDSFECLTALILEKIDRILINEIPKELESSVKDAYFLGEMIVKRIVYSIESERQSIKAKKARSHIKPLIKQLSKRKGSAKELWEELIVKMENERYEPELSSPNDKPRISYYDKNDKRKKIAFTTFSNNISEFRNN